MIGITAFEVGNCAATLLILRATDLFRPDRSQDRATQLALLLYVVYNLAATLVSVSAGRHGDRHGAPRVLAAGAVCFALAYLWFAAGPSRLLVLLPAFVLAGIGIGCAETAEHAAVANMAPIHPGIGLRSHGRHPSCGEPGRFHHRRDPVDSYLADHGLRVPGHGMCISVPLIVVSTRA